MPHSFMKTILKIDSVLICVTIAAYMLKFQYSVSIGPFHAAQGLYSIGLNVSVYFP